ncbi:hypothetical protein Slin15195_G116990 [Septoria linicola]|uniref:Mid2 domain-containing protein n=1 Tax=Septoria linicola TaxID=215465 RepID=A0A9Q9EPS2_9PEZI|nr:hypothetical protein Slin15195_G116990 [Septoria linicola]
MAEIDINDRPLPWRNATQTCIEDLSYVCGTDSRDCDQKEQKPFIQYLHYFQDSDAIQLLPESHENERAISNYYLGAYATTATFAGAHTTRTSTITSAQGQSTSTTGAKGAATVTSIDQTSATDTTTSAGDDSRATGRYLGIGLGLGPSFLILGLAVIFSLRRRTKAANNATLSDGPIDYTENGALECARVGDKSTEVAEVPDTCVTWRRQLDCPDAFSKHEEPQELNVSAVVHELDGGSVKAGQLSESHKISSVDQK